jgi:two-component system alkaline phosphatase synthesis response regulator PhoP
MALIYIVEDDQNIREIESFALKNSGYHVLDYSNAKDFYRAVKEKKPDAVLLDIMLPGKNGLDLLKELQKKVDVPIIMLTAKGDEIDKIIGLELGADDYVTKPFSIRELSARIRSVLRRSASTPFDYTQKKELCFGNLIINADKRMLIVDNNEMELTKTEFEILYLLASNPEKTFTREELLKVISDRDYESFDRSVDMHISHLRNKLKQQKSENCSIRTVWGAGYRFEVKK